MENLISLCMIVKNEEDVLERCLSSVKAFVDEIIVVDTGSTDKTKEIAKKFTNKVFDFAWIDDFSAARNFAFSKATGKYLFWLDADDVVEKSDLEKLLKFKQNLDTSVDVFMMKYEIAFDENGNSTFSYLRERILKNDGTFFFVGAVHEVITPHGKIKTLDVSIKHKKLHPSNPNRNLLIYKSLLKKRSLTPREQYYYSRELYYHKQYKKAITELNKFLKMGGWIEDKIAATEIKALCYKNLNKNDLAIRSIFEGFKIFEPNANLCCLLGDLYLNKNLHTSAFFYKNALTFKKDYSTGAFIMEDYYGYYPALSLCLVYYNLKDLNLSKYYNDLALFFKPDSKEALLNKKFFEKL